MKKQRIMFITTPLVLILICIIGFALFSNEKPFDKISIEDSSIYIHNENNRGVWPEEAVFPVEDEIISKEIANLILQAESQRRTNNAETMFLGVTPQIYIILQTDNIRYTINFTEDYGLSEEELEGRVLPQMDIIKFIKSDNGLWTSEMNWDCHLNEEQYKQLHDIIMTYQNEKEKLIHE